MLKFFKKNKSRRASETKNRDRGILVFENTSEVIRAANMKLTVHKKTMTIVNVSGGGCPDVPFLAQEMVGKPLSEAPSPRAIGHTLCGYALQLAYEEMRRRCSPS